MGNLGYIKNMRAHDLPSSLAPLLFLLLAPLVLRNQRPHRKSQAQNSRKNNCVVQAQHLKLRIHSLHCY